MTISAPELQQVLKNHKLYLDSKGARGLRANLSNQNLRGADLRGADLRDANLEGANLEEAKMSGAHLGRINLKATNTYRPLGQ